MTAAIILFTMSIFMICVGSLMRVPNDTSLFEAMCGIISSVYFGCASVCWTIERVNHDNLANQRNWISYWYDTSLNQWDKSSLCKIIEPS